MYSIGEISKMVKISVDALRYYDEINLLKPEHINENNRYRYYSEKQISEILVIMELKQYGFSLDAIKELVNCEDINKLNSAYNLRLNQLNKEFLDIKKSVNLLIKKMRAINNNCENNIENNRILIIDDSSFMRFMQKDILTKNNYTIAGEASNGNEGVAKYLEVNPSITLMNIDMPEMDGIEAVKKIKEIDKSARIIMCSSKSSIHTVLRSLAEGADDFVVKPFYADGLIEVINRTFKDPRTFNLTTILSLLNDEEFINERTTDPQPQSVINKLMNICTQEYKKDELEIFECSNEYEIDCSID